MSWQLSLETLTVSYNFLSLFVSLDWQLNFDSGAYTSVGIQENPAEEHRYVEDNLQKLALYISSSFWSDLDKSRVFLTLWTRDQQVGGVIESYHAAFCNIHGAMFPLNKLPEGLFRLMRKFCNYDKMKVLIHHQLVTGAKVALAVAKTHNPHLDLDRIKMGSGGPRNFSKPGQTCLKCLFFGYNHYRK